MGGSAAFTDQLNTAGNSGSVTFTGGGGGLIVSSSGAITTAGTLAAGTYTASGTMGDASGDSGAFAYTLTVGAITQATPTSGSVTTTGSAAFTDQLNTTGNVGAVTFTGGGGGLIVSSGGVITTTGTLAAGTYTANGTTGDASGDSGAFTYALTVNPVTITQNLPTSGSVTVAGSAAFTDQLNTSGNIGPATFTGSGAGLTVSSSGAITTTGTLAAGPHTATGTTADAFGDTGTFAYTLTVSPVTIIQNLPTSGSVTTTGSAAFTDELSTTGNGPVSFTKTGGDAGLIVSSSGAITTTGTLAAGTHTVTGTTADAFGDTGNFTYALAVSSVIIKQATPTSGSVTTTGTSAFTDQLTTTGNLGPVTFTGGGTGLTVSSSGEIATTGNLVVGSYTATGTTADAFGDTGTFTYALAVSAVIITASPTSGSVTTTDSSTFTDQLTTTGNVGTVSFSGSGTGLIVSSSGAITTTSTLAAGTHEATGTTADAFGDTGTFTYTLTVTPVTIIQAAPKSGSVTTAGSAAFRDQLSTTGNNGPVTFTGGGTGLTVSSSGAITTTSALASGTYTASGTTADAFGDTGIFAYTLTVGTMAQTAPMLGSVTTTGSSAFTDQLKATGNNGSVTFVKTGGGTGLTVSSSGQIATSGTLAKGTYTATGIMGDAFGDTGHIHLHPHRQPCHHPDRAPVGLGEEVRIGRLHRPAHHDGQHWRRHLRQDRRGRRPNRLVQRRDHHDRHPGGRHLHGDWDHGRRLR